MLGCGTNPRTNRNKHCCTILVVSINREFIVVVVVSVSSVSLVRPRAAFLFFS